MPYKDPQKQREWFQAQRKFIRKVVETAKDRPCKDCKQSYPSPIMQFDHVIGTKLFNLGSSTAQAKSIKALYNEIAKCDVVCANCHAMRTYKRRTGG